MYKTDPAHREIFPSNSSKDDSFPTHVVYKKCRSVKTPARVTSFQECLSALHVLDDFKVQILDDLLLRLADLGVVL